MIARITKQFNTNMTTTHAECPWARQGHSVALGLVPQSVGLGLVPNRGVGKNLGATVLTMLCRSTLGEKARLKLNMRRN